MALGEKEKEDTEGEQLGTGDDGSAIAPRNRDWLMSLGSRARTVYRTSAAGKCK